MDGLLNVQNRFNELSVSSEDKLILKEIKEREDEEMLLTVTANRFVLFPVPPEFQKAFDMYVEARSSYWVADEISFAQDLIDYEKLLPEEKYFINHVLAFFAASDGIVTMNLAANFLVKVPHATVNAFYGFQIAMEQIHSETYSLTLNTYVKDVEERDKLFNAVLTFPAIREKAEWALKWINDKEASFAQLLIAFVLVEGLMFSSSFCALFWLRKHNKMPGLTFSNQLISRDETMHTDFGAYLYSMLERKLPETVVHAMAREAVDIERRFITESISCAMIGMNCTSMTQYIEYIADRLLAQLGYKKIYNSTNPFDFMEAAAMECRANFFEGRVAAYAKAGVSKKAGESAIPTQLVIDADSDF